MAKVAGFLAILTCRYRSPSHANDLRAALMADTDTLGDDPDLQKYATALDELDATLRATGGVPIKGLMILGTHRKMPIDQRENEFPDNVVRATVRSEVCALTGLELFRLFYHVREMPEQKKSVRDTLFDTNGRVDISDVGEFLTRC